jgi:tetratricopeptide (TPR) repeat protein
MILEILKEETRLRMSIFEQKDFTSTIRHYSQCSVSFPDIDRLCLELTNVLYRKNYSCKFGNDDSIRLKKPAQLLWDYLLTKPIKDKLKNAGINNLVLLLDEGLISIPWELLFDGNNFLSLKFNIGRLVRTQGKVNNTQYRGPAGKLKMLILANPTGDLKSAYLEGVNIKNQFIKKSKEIKIDFKSTQIDSLYLKKNLHDYDIVHFAGHCEYDENGDNTGWVLNDRRFTAQDILTMGETVSLPSLVFSNSCQSAHVGGAYIDENLQKKTYSLASAFLFSGVRHYIGCVRKIEDPESQDFSQEFYSQLLNGESVGESLRLSRLKLICKYGINSVFWTSYLLYGDPGFSMFKAKDKAVVFPARKKYAFNRIHKNLMSSLMLVLFMFSAAWWLHIWLPTVNPNTYLLFLRSKQQFAKGKNRETVAALNTIIKKDSRFLSAYSLLGDTYYRLGQRDEALKCYYDYALNSQKRNDFRNQASAYIKIGWLYHLESNYSEAMDYYKKALILSRQSHDKINEAVALRKMAVLSMDKEDNNLALELLTKSCEINQERRGAFEHRYNLACDYFDLGLLFTNKEDFVTAREFYDKSLTIFKSLNLKYEISDYYFNIGEIYSFDKQYQKALDCYFAGLRLDQMQGNKPSLASDYNMIGELYKTMGNLIECEKYFLNALQISQDIGFNSEIALSSYNLGVLYKGKGQKNKAREHLRQAQELYRKIGMPEQEEAKKELLTL